MRLEVLAGVALLAVAALGVANDPRHADSGPLERAVALLEVDAWPAYVAVLGVAVLYVAARGPRRVAA